MSPDDPKRLWTVGLAAATVIGLELVSFQAMCVVNDYLAATQVIATALLGLSVGGLAAWFVGDADRGTKIAAAALPVSVLASFVAIARLNPYPVPMLLVLGVPYALTAAILAFVFRTLPASRVYAWDLVGAALGTLAIVIGIPWLREEGGFLLLATVGAVPLALWFGRLGAVPALLLAVATIVQLFAAPLDLLEVATADKALFADKVFQIKKADGSPLYDLRYSRGSLIERIDIAKRTDKKNRWVSIYNGRTVDVITSSKPEKGGLDARLPTLLKWGQNPDTLLVGPSGQGLTKAVRMMGDGHIDAVELNDAIASLMTHEMYERSGRAYDEMTLTVGDVRTFLARTDRRYDFITMLDTHRIYGTRHHGPPEFIHTIEAMRTYLDHLKPDGMVLFEERTVDRQAELGFTRFVQTMKAALRERGATDPAAHLAIWELWHHCTKERALATPHRCRPSQQFTFLLAKAEPFTAAEQDALRDWQALLDARTNPEAYGGIVWRHLPDSPTADRLSVAARAPGVYPDGIDPAEVDLSIVTDDRPFPFDVFHDRSELTAIVTRIVGLALLLVLLPAGLVAFGRRAEAPAPRLLGATLVLWYALLGVAYLAVEVLLVQRLAIWLGSPTWSLAIVLATMLCASGLGGTFAPRLRKRDVLVALAVVVLVVQAAAFVLPWGVDATMTLPWLGRVALAVVGVGALAFVMGLPFPWVTEIAHAKLGERYVGLLFAINGAFGAIVTPVTFVVTLMLGFHTTWLLAGAVYAACLVLLALAPTGER